jgi:uncharacterized protein
MDLDAKLKQLAAALKNLKSAAIAFSGGKDSFFLLKAAVNTLGRDKVTALFVRTLFSAKNDRRRVRYFQGKLDFTLQEITIDLGEGNAILTNPKDRCYHCKKEIFSTLYRQADQLGLPHLLDGTTATDLDEYRPGLKALEELKVVSPLLDARITSAEISQSLQKSGIDPYFLTSSTCLATRFPYDLTLSRELLAKFDDLEYYLVDLGIYPIKVRYIPDGIRLETATENFAKLLENRETIVEYCQKLGFTFPTLDLGGIKTGVWD